MTSRGSKVGVVGAGVSGLVCARELVRKGFDVNVFDKGRVPGGRTATRMPEPGLAYDHGAQYFTVRDPRFRELTADWIARGVVAEWPGRIVRLEGGAIIDTSPQPRYVGVPGMSAMAADLAAGMLVRTGMRITAATRGPDGWTIVTDDDETVGPFDSLVVTAPAPQSQELLGSHPFGAVVATVRMTPCWAVMVAFECRFEVPWDGAFVHGSPLAWVARNSSKPGRDGETDCLSGRMGIMSHHDDRPARLVELWNRRERCTSGPRRRPSVWSPRWCFGSSPHRTEASNLHDHERPEPKDFERPGSLRVVPQALGELSCCTGT